MTNSSEDVTVASESVVDEVPEAQVQMEADVKDKLAHGYVEVTEINNLKVGARVRHAGQQWSEAYRNGTATIEHIFHKPVSSWSQKYKRPDIELIVKRDGEKLDYGYWADYHTELIDTHE